MVAINQRLLAMVVERSIGYLGDRPFDLRATFALSIVNFCNKLHVHPDNSVT
ncbi:hypothetical protein [Tychonema sp. LEGE 06208]|uniref:hypothetical protein n=1 Tax=Tychonema sp. LEGE 06208 TaxID=1828663 RepID=UPI001D14BB89|nr:hypothetical protein [Tychonema sp. LEGE 06208]